MSKRSEVAGGDAGGEGRKVDSAQLPHVPGASLDSLKLTDTQKIPGSDPYNSVPVPTVPVHGHTRRGLDDTRQPSTRIKAPAAGERPALTSTSDLALRLAGMRVELERVLSDMETQGGLAVDYADRKAAGLIQKLRESARHLEDAIDSLLPPDQP